MKIKAKYENKDDIPEAHLPLFSERNGVWELTEVEGLRTQEDIDRAVEAKRKEANDHAETKAKLKKYEGIDPETAHADMDELKELRALKEAGSLEGADEEAINKRVEAQVATRTAPLERELKTLREENETQKTSIAEFQEADRTRTIRDAVTKAATESKIVTSALEDVTMLSERVFDVAEDGTVTVKDGMGTTPGIDPATWLSEMREKRPHWWPASQGGGAKGGGSGDDVPNNPFSAAHWNLTEQGKIVNSDPAKADRLAALAGVKVGDIKPAAA